jgi:tRNA modification GTPase
MLYSGDRDGRTICAVSTPAGYGGISVIRVSGPQAGKISQKIAPKLTRELESHRAYLCATIDPKTKTEIDQCLFTFFSHGKSFTGEETVEISCHGNPLICDQIMQALISAGAIAALPGEFTYRAFMNNKIDLIQAESVLSLIESRSKQSAKLAYRQLQGGLSKRVEIIENELTWCLAHIEASIDFSTEGLETTSQETLIQKLGVCLTEISEMLKTYQKGRMLRDGVQIALIGRPNVGKSSLLNLLLGYERSIVTDIAGTTRDVVSDETQYEGQRLCFLDTAGVRKATQDRVEKLGIEKTIETARGADLILFVFDSVLGFTDEDKEQVLFLGNKTDLTTQKKQADSLKIIHSLQGFSSAEVLFCSTLDRSYQGQILDSVIKKVMGSVQIENDLLVSNARHFEQLNLAVEKIEQTLKSLKSGHGAELTSLDLKEALISLQAILGKFFDDQIMDRVFKEFCIGK